MTFLKGISDSCADFMEEVRAAANGQPPTPRPRQAPAVTQATATHAPPPAHGGQPPNQPPAHGGGGGGSGSAGSRAWLSKDNPLFWLVALIVLVVAYMGVTYVTTSWISDANNRVNGITPPAQAAPSPIQYSPAPVAQNQTRTIDNITDGMEFALPENARVILRGPMSVTFTDSTATKIKGFTGDFKLHIEGSQNFAWTPGFSPEAAPMSPSDFLGHLRRILAQKPNQVKVKMFINNGVVELNT